MEGDLTLVSVPDLLQMICLGGYSRDIHLFEGPTQVGVIAIRNGRVDRCFGFGIWGEAAFYKLVNLHRGRYKVNEAQDMSASDAVLTAHSWQELLMEAARRQDEAEHIAQSAAGAGRVIAFPSPPGHAAASVAPAIAFPSILDSAPHAISAASSGVVAAPADERASAGLSAPHPDIAELLAEATTHYLRRDLARAEEILQQCLALRPGDKRVLQNLERIRRKKSP
jgi:hypothetical protein